MTALNEKRVLLSSDQARRLRELAKQHHLSEEQIIIEALDVLLSPAFPLHEFLQRQDRIVRSESPSVKKTMTEDAFKHYLSSVGLLAVMPPLEIQMQSDRSPISILGEPLSQTVVEERR